MPGVRVVFCAGVVVEEKRPKSNFARPGESWGIWVRGLVLPARVLLLFLLWVWRWYEDGGGLWVVLAVTVAVGGGSSRLVDSVIVCRLLPEELLLSEPFRSDVGPS